MATQTKLTLHEARIALGLYSVPCNGCTACCKNDAVRLLPHEDIDQWEVETHPYMPGAIMLAHKPNGDCVYLGETGCNQQTNKPQQCHEMDCRNIAKAITKSQAKQLAKRGGLKIEIWLRGKELLRSTQAVTLNLRPALTHNAAPFGYQTSP